MPVSEFANLLDRDYVVPDEPAPPPEPAMRALALQVLANPELLGGRARDVIESLCAEIDLRLTTQINVILHHPEFQALEATWRGLYFLVTGTETGPQLKIKFLNVGKRDLMRSLRKYRGAAWDRSPIFKHIYEEEYGQFGGEPYGILIGDYYLDHRPEDQLLIADMAAIAAAAHVPFIAGAAPAVMQMDSWTELANPRDLTRIFQTPEYVAWRALRQSEDTRYIGLCMPRFLARLPYGTRTDPVEAFAFEEETEAANCDAYLWCNAAYAFGANVARAFALYGWCTRIRGVDSGGVVENLPVPTFPTADGEVDLRGVTEVALSERREAELAKAGFIPLVQRKNEGVAAFISAQSLQKPFEYDEGDATANAILSSRLPYLFACCRFAHFLKCMVRDKIGSTRSLSELKSWLDGWLLGYTDGSPSSSSEDWKAAHPLQEARVSLEEKPNAPGEYDAKFYLRPHYQMEGLTVALRLVSRMPAP
jgi:type VI secretion system protein ImpC